MTFDQILSKIKSGKSIFITGGAGSGKSYTLMKLKEALGSQITLTASTGIASINIGGLTIHSFAKLGIGTDGLEKILNKIKKDKRAEKRLLNCKILAIDEISMLSSKMLNLLDSILKAVRSSNRPFGGVVMVFLGDFLQLPPVIKNPEEDGLCLFCKSWKEAEIETILLSSNYRQKDDIEFFNLLTALRFGEDINFAYNKLQSRVLLKPEKNVINLVSHKEQAFEINSSNLAALPFEEKVFVASYEGKEEFVRSYLPHFEDAMVIKIKKGARVMLNFNLNIEEGLCNGALGNVVDFDKSGSPIVLFDGMTHVNIILQNDVLIEDSFTSEVLFSFRQIPLQLAYSVTIHKSQGLTFESIKADISRCFAFGQAYVSLSRAKSLSGLYLNNFNKNVFKVNYEIAAFYKSLEL